jgi:hypothetical protein
MSKGSGLGARGTGKNGRPAGSVVRSSVRKLLVLAVLLLARAPRPAPRALP